MSDQTTAQPTAQTVNWNNLRCLYAEDIKDGKVKFNIAGIRDTPKGARLFCQSGESEAFDIALFYIKQDGSISYADKDGKTRYIQIPKANTFGKRTGLLRQYVMVCGSEPTAQHVGKSIILYTKESAKSVTGKAIRIADVSE